MSTKEAMKKLDTFKRDILRYLKSIEPQTAYYRDIKEQLAPKHRSKYKDNRVYGSALTHHLNWLLKEGLIKKDKETLEYGTPKAHFGKREPSKNEPSIIPILICLILLVPTFLFLYYQMPNAVQYINVSNITAWEKHLATVYLNISYSVVAILISFFGGFAVLVGAKYLMKNKPENTFLSLKFQ